MDRQKTKKIMERFQEVFGSTDGLRCARAPGRVNLIGEHTDYNGGFVLPMAIDREVRIYFRPMENGPSRIWSENYGEWDEFDVDNPDRNPDQPWTNYIRGVAWALAKDDWAVQSIEGVVFGDVPLGAGLSSSAAIEVASALALSPDAAAATADRGRLALTCQKAENDFVGVNCGIMDQFVSLHAASDRAVLLDCRSLEHQLLPLDTTVVRVVVCNTMADHELSSSAYNQRRATCEQAATDIGVAEDGVTELRDVSLSMLERRRELLDETEYRRAKHVVSENDRARTAVDALESANYDEFGDLMNASHESLRIDYEVSCEELDAMVEAARSVPGCLGARMTGAGFGGCTVNLVRTESAEGFVSAVREEYQERTGIEPEIYEFTASHGATLETHG
ncbi:MAG: galactokinase [Candidatus Brocadiia bacterium]